MEKYNLIQLSILIVEQHSLIRYAIREILKQFWPREVWDTADMEEVRELIEIHHPDVIFTDCAPAFDGIDLVRKIRDKENGPDRFLPIIIVSAYTDLKTVLNARGSGANEFLTKPFTATSIYKRLCSLIERERYFIQCATFFGLDRRRRRLDWSKPERHAPARVPIPA
ncbi:MAG: response regulator [Rhodospirillales bacterium]|jgi:DNA-binding NarL/FixJ family response regulator|nr:response regulator [Rhodospirillales bacterium]